ncbi:MAG: glycosyltransferase family 4 protein, partial [Fervidicoccus fontis]
MNSDILFVFPGYLEALTRRGGGREETLLEVATRLSNSFNVRIVSPFFGKYTKTIQLSSTLTINNLYFPTLKNYPYSKNWFSNIVSSLSVFLFYEFLVIMKLIELKKKGLKIVVLSDIISGILPTIFAKLLKIKIVYYEGNLTPWIDYRILSRNTSLMKSIWHSFTIIVGCVIGEMADSIIVNDGLIKGGMIHHGISEDKICIIRGGVDTNKFKPMEAEPYPEAEFVAGFIGRLTDEKGAPALLDFCKIALYKLPQVKIIILGDGPYRRDFEILPNVKYVGWVDHNILYKWMRFIDVVLSFQRTFGRGEIEALACGKPVIAYRIGEMPKLIKNGENGLLCQPRIDS